MHPTSVGTSWANEWRGGEIRWLQRGSCGRSTHDFLFLSFFSSYQVGQNNAFGLSTFSEVEVPWVAVESNHTRRQIPTTGDEGPIEGVPHGLNATPQSHPNHTQQGTPLKLFLFGDRILSILRGRACMPLLGLGLTGLNPEAHMQFSPRALPAHRQYQNAGDEPWFPRCVPVSQDEGMPRNDAIAAVGWL
ncbi:hypothetical protein BJX96DRAFT_97383 [Aspergillus floccosus]